MGGGIDHPAPGGEGGADRRGFEGAAAQLLTEALHRGLIRLAGGDPGRGEEAPDPADIEAIARLGGGGVARPGFVALVTFHERIPGRPGDLGSIRTTWPARRARTAAMIGLTSFSASRRSRVPRLLCCSLPSSVQRAFHIRELRSGTKLAIGTVILRSNPRRTMSRPRAWGQIAARRRSGDTSRARCPAFADHQHGPSVRRSAPARW